MSGGQITPLARTLDQELMALVRGASLECVVCGEFVLRFAYAVACPECRSILADGTEVPIEVLPERATNAC
jgi:Zn finger protein HypA/HybF involved in hydrogenase expression